ncbi:uncharacterized protein AUP68_17193 [Ilyonectria robusta]
MMVPTKSLLAVLAFTTLGLSAPAAPPTTSNSIEERVPVLACYGGVWQKCVSFYTSLCPLSCNPTKPTKNTCVYNCLQEAQLGCKERCHK